MDKPIPKIDTKPIEEMILKAIQDANTLIADFMAFTNIASPEIRVVIFYFVIGFIIGIIAMMPVGIRRIYQELRNTL